MYFFKESPQRAGGPADFYLYAVRIDIIYYFQQSHAPNLLKRSLLVCTEVRKWPGKVISPNQHFKGAPGKIQSGCNHALNLQFQIW